MSYVSCIVMMSVWVLCTRFVSSSILFLMPFILFFKEDLLKSTNYIQDSRNERHKEYSYSQKKLNRREHGSHKTIIQL